MVKALVQHSFKSANSDGNWIKALIFYRHFSVNSPKAFLQKLSAIPSNALLSCQDHLAIKWEIYLLGLLHFLLHKWKLSTKFQHYAPVLSLGF